MRFCLAVFGFSLIITIAACESMLRIVEEARKRRLQASTYLTAESYPVLARIWDNEDDAIFDDLEMAQKGGRNGQEAR